MPTASDLDAALLASIGSTWTKVAMVLGRAAKVPGLDFEEKDEEYSILSARLESLVASGAVLARGDLKHWRVSEVRLSGVDLDKAQPDLKRLAEKLGGDDDGPKRA